MARFFIDDSSGDDQRSLLNTSKFARFMGQSTPMVAARRKYLVTNAQSGTFSLTMLKGCVFRVGPHMCYTDADVELSSANLHQLSGDDFVNGHDYAVFAYLSPDAIANNLAESYIIIDCNNELPKGYNEDTCLCVGGFHYGYCATYDKNYYITQGAAPHLGVLEFSIWTLLHRIGRPDGDGWKNNRGMTYIPPINKWVGIYISQCSDGYPAYGSNITRLVKPPSGWDTEPYEALLNSVCRGKGFRPCTFSEYLAAGFGSPAVTANDNTNAWISTSNQSVGPNGGVVNAVSLYGCKDIIGLMREAFFDPSGVLGKVLCSSTTYNSGGNHKVVEMCSHTDNDFAWRLCADNCY